MQPTLLALINHLPVLPEVLLLVGACALMIAGLRAVAWPAFGGGLALTTSLAFACASLDIRPLEHPALYVAPTAVFLVGWAVLTTWRIASAAFNRRRELMRASWRPPSLCRLPASLPA